MVLDQYARAIHIRIQMGHLLGLSDLLNEGFL